MQTAQINRGLHIALKEPPFSDFLHTKNARGNQYHKILFVSPASLVLPSYDVPLYLFIKNNTIPVNKHNNAINKIPSNGKLLKLNNGMFYHFCNLFLYSLGVNLYFSLKTRLKVLRLPKPLSIEISVRVSSVVSIL